MEIAVQAISVKRSMDTLDLEMVYNDEENSS